MGNIQTINDISKETLTFLAFFDDEIIKNIPSNVITKLCEEAADSTVDFFIDINKTFAEQNISEKSKDLISLIYHNYIADEVEKKEIENKWKLNNKNFEALQEEKYNTDNLFKNSQKNNKHYAEQQQVNAMIKYKESLFKKILIKIQHCTKSKFCAIRNRIKNRNIPIWSYL